MEQVNEQLSGTRHACSERVKAAELLTRLFPSMRSAFARSPTFHAAAAISTHRSASARFDSKYVGASSLIALAASGGKAKEKKRLADGAAEIQRKAVKAGDLPRCDERRRCVTGLLVAVQARPMKE